MDALQEIEGIQIPNISEFDILETMKDTHNFSCAVFGKRRMGKSILIKDLIHKTKSWFTEIYVFSQSSHLQPDLYDYCPKNNIFNNFNEEKLIEIWNRQERYIMQELKKGRKKKDLPVILIVFDDVIGDPRVRNSKIFNDLHILGRHVNFASIVLSQEFGGKSGLPKVARANEDLVISFFPNAEYDRKLIIEQYLSTKTKKLGEAILRNVCKEEYQAIVVANFMTEIDPEKYIFKFKARPKVPKFEIGGKLPPTSAQIDYLNAQTFGMPKEYEEVYREMATRRRRGRTFLGDIENGF